MISPRTTHLLATLFLTFGLMLSCNSDDDKKSGDNTGSNQINGVGANAGNGGQFGANCVSFQDLQQTFQAKCLTCHTTTPPVFATAAQAQPLAQQILSSITGGRMPPPGRPALTQPEINQVQLWANAGGPQTQAQCAPTSTVPTSAGGTVTTPGAAGSGFGSTTDVQYAAKIWSAIQAAGMLGNNYTHTISLLSGQEPHGPIREVKKRTSVTVEGQSGEVYVKHNYGGNDITMQKVIQNRGSWRKAVTVMYKRPGYSSTTGDWFWVKFKTNGEVDTNPAGKKLAGLVGKDTNDACMGCHAKAGGNDYVFANDGGLSP